MQELTDSGWRTRETTRMIDTGQRQRNGLFTLQPMSESIYITHYAFLAAKPIRVSRGALSPCTFILLFSIFSYQTE